MGVGGQGTLLASRILSAGLVKAGYDLKMSEIHGMAQRVVVSSLKSSMGGKRCMLLW